MTEWIEVLKVLVDGPKVPVQGVVRTLRDDRTDKSIPFAFVGEAPLFVGIDDADDVRVWRDGMRVRVEDLEGKPLFISDGHTIWKFDGAAEPVHAEIGRAYYHGLASGLVISRDSRDWVNGDDFTQPTGPVGSVDYLGRSCWTVELAPPPHKKFPIQLTIDTVSGAILQRRNDGYGTAVGFIDITVGEPIADEVFTWKGPSRSLVEVREAERVRWQRAEEEKQAAFQDWFGTNVADPKIEVWVLTDLSIGTLREFDKKSGSFTADIGAEFGGGGLSGGLSRRPRSDKRWVIHANAVIHLWSTENFDWAVWSFDTDLGADAMRQLQRHLHPGEPAVNERVRDRSEKGRR